MTKIYVGYEYKEAFDGIATLIQGGCLEGVGKKYTFFNGVISDGTYQFELLEQSSELGKSIKHKFEKKGATWFKALRGEKFENNNAIWTKFIEDVAIEYHKKYSVMEYEQQISSKENEADADRNVVNAINWLVENFYPDLLGKLDMYKVKDETACEDIYGVSMRMDLSGGTGESLPVLTKVYFTKHNDELKPIKTMAAQKVDENLKKIIPIEETSTENIFPEKVINSTMRALSNLINSESFAEHVCFSDKADEEAVDNLVSKLLHDAIELECTKVDVLYITHVKSVAFVYDFYYMGMPIFRAIIGSNDSISVYCLICEGEEALVFSNDITYYENNVQKNISIDLSKENFGVSSEDMQILKTNSVLLEHCIKVKCANNPRNKACEVLVCRKNAIEVVVANEKVFKCKYCPYPEVVYTDRLGVKHYTPDMVFVKDRMELVSKDDEEIKTAECKVCGRRFSSNKLKNGACPLCASLEYLDEEAKERYKQYRNILPISTRLIRCFSKKYCVEDEELIIFVLGKKYYVFNKLDATEKGYICKPRKLN